MRGAGWVALLLFAGSLVNYVDRAVLGVLMPELRRDLGLTATGYAMAVNAFLVAYTVFYVLGGRIADTVGGRRAYTWSVAVWSMAAMAHAFVGSGIGLAGCRAVLGMGQGGYYPAAIHVAAKWFPPERRAAVIGLILSAISVGTLLTPPLAAWLTIQFSWRVAFLVTGALGLLLLPPWLRAGRGPEMRGTGGGPLLPALRNKRYGMLLAARACTDSAWYFYLFWMPGYFREARGLSLAEAGAVLWIPYLGAGIGALSGAAASGWLLGRGWEPHRARKALLTAGALVASTGAASCFTETVGVSLALVSVALFAHQFWSTNLHTAITEAVPPAQVAILYGITGAAGTLAGVVVQSAVGWLVDHGGYEPAFLMTTVLYLTGAALVRLTPNQSPA